MTTNDETKDSALGLQFSKNTTSYNIVEVTNEHHQISDDDSHIEVPTITQQANKADVTLDFMETYDAQVPEITPFQETKLQHKLYRKVLLICFVINLIMFMDKNAMGYSKLLGLWDDIGLTKKQYSNTNSLFYAGYLIGQIPGHYLFQRVPIRIYMTATLLCWTILMFVQLGAKDYAAIATIRFFLGLTESVVTPCLEHTMAMFFTIKEQGIIAPIFWIGTVGVGIPTGFIAYGVQYYTGSLHPWRLYWIINGSLTVLLAIWVALDYPQNPATYSAFSIQERVQIIRRNKKQSRSSIEEKRFKPGQLYEALKDPVSWLFAVYAFTSMLANNMNYQNQVIYTSLGISRLHSTLITVVQAAYSAVAFILGSYILAKTKNKMTYLAVISNVPAVLGGILAVSLSWDHKIGILAACIIVHTERFAYIIALCWSQSSAAGYTKKLTRTTMFMIGYGLSNIVAPQMWIKGSPRYYSAWTVQIVVAWFGSSFILLTIRGILSKRNTERLKKLVVDDEGHVVSLQVGYIRNGSEEGGGPRKVDISMLDLTDVENKEFIYPL